MGHMPLMQTDRTLETRLSTQLSTRIQRPWSVQRYSKAVKVQTFWITFNTIFEGTESQNDDEFQCFLAQIHYFEKLEIECSPYFKGVKGRLAKHLEFGLRLKVATLLLTQLETVM